MSIEVLDPTYGDEGAEFALASRLDTVEGKTIGIISNGKRGTRPYFAALERALLNAGASRVVLCTKTNYSAPADASIIAQVPEWDAAFTGIGD
jgi:hypothetical protein